MSTAKEKVLAYFEEWAGKGINPANGVRIWEQSKRLWNIMRDTPKGGVHLYHVMDYEDSPADDFRFEIAARILKLDKPRAAEIQWRELITGDAHAGGGGYLIEQRGAAGWAAYFQGSRFEDRLYPSLEAAKKACQDHKQGRLEELL